MTSGDWLHDADSSVVSFVRKGRTKQDVILAVFNFTPVPRFTYGVGVPRGGFWEEVLNSDAREYGGSGLGNGHGVEATPVPFHGRPYSLNLTLPPLSAMFLKSPGP